jgi:plasmid replication initiation protein
MAFGHLEIGKNPTEEKNSFLVFRISFSSLNTKNVESFEQSLNKSLNSAVRDFKNAYESIFTGDMDKILLDEGDGVESFKSLTDFVKKSEFRSKVTGLTLISSYTFLLMNMIIQ